MPHFFVNSQNINDNIISITDKDTYKHIARALRVKKGEKLLLIDENQIQYETVVADVTTSEVIVKIENSYKSSRSLPFGLYLAQSPLRSDAQSFVVEKATELGVKGVYPVCSDNCALSKEIIDKKIDKWQRIMFEASKQCERADIPTCFSQDTYENLIKKFDRIIVFCERIASKTLKDIKPIKKGENVLVIIGPEGGFSEREFKLFEEYGLDMLTLGNLILKAETAVTVALGNIIYEFTSANN
ncbi:MAG: 16S rRNA (uracil(1498)-N(3))-methyltransferase [Cyanobacteria bacterium SIG32]|nr:16S rRNA (uracil(1498)-N(3))-methyltransferase [Cyanobacteria bacterium SIG32]